MESQKSTAFLIAENLVADGSISEEETLSVLMFPGLKWGVSFGRKGSSILAIKESCNAEIHIGGDKGPPYKVFIMGPVKQVRKAEAMIRGRMLDL
nr:exosome component 10 isoform X2 [Ipomoea batatas]